MLFAIFLVKCARQRQDSKRFMLSFAWQYQNSQAYEKNHYSRTFLVIALVKQKISNRLKCWSSLFADILLHYGTRTSPAQMFWSSKCDDGTRSAVPVTADFVPPPILSPRTKSASGYCPPGQYPLADIVPPSPNLSPPQQLLFKLCFPLTQ